MEHTVFLKAEKIIKEFAGVRVLDQVDFEIRKGEVHSLLGENGAGKSTLIKIITGVYQKDGGTLFVNGAPVSIDNRQDSIKNGIAVVYQEFSLMPTLTVAQNVLAGREISRLGFLDQKKMRSQVQDLIEEYGFSLSADDLVGNLGIAECQMVEILKALSFHAQLVIMDEPTSALSVKESEALFTIIRNLRAKGVSILYISHRLDEVYMLSDRITVLRDGKNSGLFDKDEIEPGAVVHAMIGKAFESDRSKELKPGSGEKVLEVRGLSRQGAFEDLCFDVHKGEILGIAGLVGSGRTEMLRSIFGVDPYDSGTVKHNGQPVHRKAHRNIQAGIGFITEDRRGEGFVPFQSIEKNLAMVSYESLSRWKVFFSKAKSRRFSENVVAKMNIKPADPNAKVMFLSGGNQQKVVVGKWLFHGSQLMLVDEPTVGVDIGAKEEIYSIMEEYARQGVTILLVSSDNEELLRVSTRILVFRKGKIVREFDNGRLTQKDLMFATSNLDQDR